MIKKIFIIILCATNTLIPSVITILDQRAGAKEGVFAGVQRNKDWVYKQTTPGKSVVFDLGLNKIDSVRWFEPTKNILYSAPIRQPGILTGVFTREGLLTITDTNGSYLYHKSDGLPKKGIRRQQATIKKMTLEEWKAESQIIDN